MVTPPQHQYQSLLARQSNKDVYKRVIIQFLLDSGRGSPGEQPWCAGLDPSCLTVIFIQHLTAYGWRYGLNCSGWCGESKDGSGAVIFKVQYSGPQLPPDRNSIEGLITPRMPEFNSNRR